MALHLTQLTTHHVASSSMCGYRELTATEAYILAEDRTGWGAEATASGLPSDDDDDDDELT